MGVRDNAIHKSEVEVKKNWVNKKNGFVNKIISLNILYCNKISK